MTYAAAAMMQVKQKWSGTARQLQKLLELPYMFGDFRTASKALGMHKAYLEKHRVQVEFHIPEGSHSKKIILRKQRALRTPARSES